MAAALLAAGLAAWRGLPGPGPARAVGSFPGEKAQALRDSLRRLWTDEAYWTRDAIKDTHARHPERRAVSGRLLRAHDELGALLGSYLGPEEGQRLAALLREHAALAVEAAAASRRGDTRRLDAAHARWRENAGRLAERLAALNPYWGERTRALLEERVNWAARAAVAQAERDWPADLAAADGAVENARRLADELAAGLVDRFPERF